MPVRYDRQFLKALSRSDQLGAQEKVTPFTHPREASPI